MKEQLLQAGSRLVKPEFSRAVAKSLNRDDTLYPIGEELVAEALEKVVTLDLIMHGMRRVANIEGVKAKGVLPLTPEGSGSFWGRGLSNFGYFKDDYFETFDTPLFHYAGTSILHEGAYRAGLAVVQFSAVLEAGLATDESGPGKHLVIHDAVPPDLLTVVEASGHTLPEAERNLVTAINEAF